MPEAVAKRELDVLQTGLARFSLDCKRYPSDSEGLPALLNNPGLFGWRGPDVTLLRSDPWGHEYFYRPATNADARLVLRAGQDGVEGTADDVWPPPLDKEALKAYVLGEP